MSLESFISEIPDRKAYRKTDKISGDIIAVYWKWMQNPSFKKAYDKLYYGDLMTEGKKVDDQDRMFALMTDLAKCNIAIGYNPSKHDQASMVMYQVMQCLSESGMTSYKAFKVVTNHKDASRLILGLYADFMKISGEGKNRIGLAEVLNEYSHQYMNYYLDTLQKYTRYIGEKDGANTNAVKAWNDKLEFMKDHSIPSSGIECLLPANYRSTVEAKYRQTYRTNNSKPETDPDFWDMTKDYLGKHGEFDYNDEARRISEDIQQFHNANPDADLSDHYYWEDILNAETDGYLDD